MKISTPPNPVRTDVERALEDRAFIGLGGNLGDRLAIFQTAMQTLAREVPATRLITGSSVYETRPIGPSVEPFLNAVVEVRTRLSPHGLLEHLRRIETQHGRQRRRRWDARTLDLDVLLLYRPTVDDARRSIAIADDRLVVPHPRMTARDFVMVPLGELLGPDVLIEGRSLRQWLHGLDGSERTILRCFATDWLDGIEGGGSRERP